MSHMKVKLSSFHSYELPFESHIHIKLLKLVESADDTPLHDTRYPTENLTVEAYSKIEGFR